MRLAEIDKGDTIGHRALIGFISLVSGMRLPDAARVAFYHQEFLGGALGNWTHETMRGDSEWTVYERELMAAMVAKWNSCAFCVGAHSAIAAKALPRPTVDAALFDYRNAGLTPALTAALGFLEVMTKTPEEVVPALAQRVLQAGVSKSALEDAIAVGSIFAIVTRYADALRFAMPTDGEFDKAANMLLKRGYKS